jgi:hypothetical protein
VTVLVNTVIILGVQQKGKNISWLLEQKLDTYQGLCSEAGTLEHLTTVRITPIKKIHLVRFQVLTAANMNDCLLGC